jgi:hypothetical protein
MNDVMTRGDTMILYAALTEEGNCKHKLYTDIFFSTSCQINKKKNKTQNTWN